MQVEEYYVGGIIWVSTVKFFQLSFMSEYFHTKMLGKKQFTANKGWNKLTMLSFSWERFEILRDVCSDVTKSERFSLVTCFIQSCIYSNPNLPPHPTPLSPLGVHTLVLCLYICPTNRLICTIFLDATSMHWYVTLVVLFLTYFYLYDSL